MSTNPVEPEDLDDDTIEVDDTPDEPEPYAPPSETEWARTQEALKKANAQAKQYRLAARSGGRPAMGPGSDAEGVAAETEKAMVKAKAEATEEAEKAWKPRLVKAYALAAFAAAGCKSPERAARLLDLDSITFDDDGNPEGLDDQVEELKDDMPEMFERGRGRSGPSRPGSVDAGPKGPAAPKKLSATERQLQRSGLLR